VVICTSQQQAAETLTEMLAHAKFGNASEQVVIEEFLEGIELSTFVLTDGQSYKVLPSAKDYKRIGEGDTGLNTGGMGAVSPVPFADQDFLQKIEDRIIKPTIQGLKQEGIDYKGFIFLGLINVNGDPKVIEYNVRMGDPETQVVLPRISSDLVELLLATAQGKLEECTLQLDPRTATTVVMVSGGYPGSYEKGHAINGLDSHLPALVFHAGTKEEAGQVVTNGGRVLAITSFGEGIQDALDGSYARISQIDWQQANYRRDIGKDLL
jgi:phosphoribosylamine--glycine ligase